MALNSSSDSISSISSLQSFEDVIQENIDSKKTCPISVAVRIRPLNPNEVRKENVQRIQKTSKNCLVVDDNGQPSFSSGSVTLQESARRKVDGSKNYTLDNVFGPDDSQLDIFEACVAPLVRNFTNGYNATAIAYGQTGTGKTFTMGSAPQQRFDLKAALEQQDAGIIPRASKMVFDVLQKLSNKSLKSAKTGSQSLFAFILSASFIELYNDEIIDLLASPESASLRVLENGKGEIVIPNISERVVTCPEEIFVLLKEGSIRRQVGDNGVHDRSSRSHAILTLSLLVQSERLSLTDNCELQTRHSKFHFVDLAGSERMKKNKSTKERAQEGIAINTELHVLGKVICALSQQHALYKKAAFKGEVPFVHVPYRDSKLTRILQDSLGGNAKTVIISCLSPSAWDLSESKNTLRYATQARQISNQVFKKGAESADSKRISDLRKELQAMRAQISAPIQNPASLVQSKTEGEQLLYGELKLRTDAYVTLKNRFEVLQEELSQLKEEKMESETFDKLESVLNSNDSAWMLDTRRSMLFRNSVLTLSSPFSKSAVLNQSPAQLSAVSLPDAVPSRPISQMLVNRQSRIRTELDRYQLDQLWQKCAEYEEIISSLNKQHDAKLSELIERWEQAQNVVNEMETKVSNVSLELSKRESESARLEGLKNESERRVFELSKELEEKNTEMEKLVAGLEHTKEQLICEFIETKTIATSPMLLRDITIPDSVVLANLNVDNQTEFSTHDESAKAHEQLLQDKIKQQEIELKALREQLAQMHDHKVKSPTSPRRAKSSKWSTTLEAMSPTSEKHCFTEPKSPIDIMSGTADSSESAVAVSSQALQAASEQLREKEREVAKITAMYALCEKQYCDLQDEKRIDRAVLESLKNELQESSQRQGRLEQQLEEYAGLKNHMESSFAMLEKQQSLGKRASAAGQELQLTVLRLQTQAAYLEALRLTQEETITEYEDRFEALQEALDRVLQERFTLLSTASKQEEENRSQQVYIKFLQEKFQTAMSLYGLKNTEAESPVPRLQETAAESRRKKHMYIPSPTAATASPNKHIAAYDSKSQLPESPQADSTNATESPIACPVTVSFKILPN